MATQATLTYSVTPTARTAAQLALQIASGNVPLEPSYFTVTSTSLTSDTTAVVGGTARRIVVVNLTQGPLLIAPTNILATAQYTPSVFSKSANDALGGTGLQTIQLQYTDAAGNPHTENINMNGKTPVSAVNTNYFRLTGWLNVASGADLSNDGQIFVTVPTANLTGANPAIVKGTTVLALVDVSFYVKFPNASQRALAFQSWLNAALRAQVGAVLEKAVVFA